jgi:hypothetical protein
MPFGDPASHVIFVNWLENSTSWKTAIDHWPFVFVKTQAKRPFRAVFSEPGKVDRSGASPLAFQETRIVIGFGRRLSSYRFLRLRVPDDAFVDFRPPQVSTSVLRSSAAFHIA